MKIGLIGCTGHWHSYAGALKSVPAAELAAVALSGREESLANFDRAPGMLERTPRFQTALEMLERVKLDAVQICSRPDLLASFCHEALKRNVAVFCEKPIAMNMEALEQLYHAVRRTRVPFLPMHMMRNHSELIAVREAIRAGSIGEPLLAFSQKSYRWGERPAWFKDRATFPGTMAYIGIHAMDWLYWMLGDLFTQVHGCEGAARKDFPGCASQCAYTLSMQNGGAASITVDYLRPASAPTHGDDRVRIAGTAGVVEARLAEKLATVTTADHLPAALSHAPEGDLFADWLRSIQGKTTPPMSVYDAFRVTEIALRAQEAADLRQAAGLTTIFDSQV
jgi:predicted dehydrogenase